MTLIHASENETFITLISAAKEDAAFARRVLAITQLPEKERTKKVKHLITDCEKQHAPKDFINALSLLSDSAIAQKVNNMLSNKLPETN